MMRLWSFERRKDLNIIKELYEGTLCPGKYVIPQNEEYRPLSLEIGNLREYFEAKLPEEDLKKYEKLNMLQDDLEEMLKFAAFEYGFKLGSGFAHEAISEEPKYEETEKRAP